MMAFFSDDVILRTPEMQSARVSPSADVWSDFHIYIYTVNGCKLFKRSVYQGVVSIFRGASALFRWACSRQEHVTYIVEPHCRVDRLTYNHHEYIGIPLLCVYSYVTPVLLCIC
jgi:hypothetical protein